MSYTHAMVGAQGGVLRLVQADELPGPGEHLEALPAPLATWPAVPFKGAQLRLVQGALAWHDPRPQPQRSADARAARDALLAGCDWRVVRATELGQPVSAAWAAYRQQLRDVPEQSGFPDDITWPTPPET